MKQYNRRNLCVRIAKGFGIFTAVVLCVCTTGTIWFCWKYQKELLNETKDDCDLESGIHSERNINETGNEEESFDEAWKLILVNPWNPLPEDYTVRTVELINGQAVDERCYPDLQEMMDDCRAAGLSPYICSSYRTWEKQSLLFEENVEILMAQGNTEEEARNETAKSIAVPGTSEHQLGLAVDIVDKNYQVLDDEQENTEVQQWLMDNSWRYGFILRYPTNKSSITGIVYEPWHYRYVGKEAASEIYHSNICLEEYLEKIPLLE